MNLIEETRKKAKEVCNVLEFKNASDEQLGAAEQMLTAPYWNARAALDITMFPSDIEIPSEELYKIWINALNEISVYSFLVKEYLDGRVFN